MTTNVLIATTNAFLAPPSYANRGGAAAAALLFSFLSFPPPPPLPSPGLDPSVTAAAVVITGLMGVNFCQTLLSVFRYKDAMVRGVATGGAAHGLGTAALAGKASREEQSRAEQSEFSLALSSPFSLAIPIPIPIPVIIDGCRNPRRCRFAPSPMR